MSIKKNIQSVRNDVPEKVTIVAVSKTKPNEDIMEAYEAYQRIFGENKVQELVDKYEALPKDIEWHMIGHLQRNKVKYITPFISLIHGVDSFRLLKEINKSAAKNERVVDILLQFFIAQEESKFGFDLKEAKEVLNSEEFKSMKNIRVRGVMGMASNTEDGVQVGNEFKSLRLIFDTLKQDYFSDEDSFEHISMGMSGDYPIAIEEGSTMVRVGSSIFGARNYPI